MAKELFITGETPVRSTKLNEQLGLGGSDTIKLTAGEDIPANSYVKILDTDATFSTGETISADNITYTQPSSSRRIITISNLSLSSIPTFIYLTQTSSSGSATATVRFFGADEDTPILTLNSQRFRTVIHANYGARHQVTINTTSTVSETITKIEVQTSLLGQASANGDAVVEVAISKGDVVVAKNNDVYKIDADGFVKTGVSAGGTAEVYVAGVLDMESVEKGAIYYLGEDGTASTTRAGTIGREKQIGIGVESGIYFKTADFEARGTVSEYDISTGSNRYFPPQLKRTISSTNQVFALTTAERNGNTSTLSSSSRLYT